MITPHEMYWIDRLSLSKTVSVIFLFNQLQTNIPRSNFT